MHVLVSSIFSPTGLMWACPDCDFETEYECEHESCPNCKAVPVLPYWDEAMYYEDKGCWRHEPCIELCDYRDCVRAARWECWECGVKMCGPCAASYYRTTEIYDICEKCIDNGKLYLHSNRTYDISEILARPPILYDADHSYADYKCWYGTIRAAWIQAVVRSSSAAKSSQHTNTWCAVPGLFHE